MKKMKSYCPSSSCLWHYRRSCTSITHFSNQGSPAWLARSGDIGRSIQVVAAGRYTLEVIASGEGRNLRLDKVVVFRK